MGDFLLLKTSSAKKKHRRNKNVVIKNGHEKKEQLLLFSIESENSPPSLLRRRFEPYTRAQGPTPNPEITLASRPPIPATIEQYKVFLFVSLITSYTLAASDFSTSNSPQHLSHLFPATTKLPFLFGVAYAVLGRIISHHDRM